jgi:putative CocE/NonD family hydrolase
MGNTTSKVAVVLLVVAAVTVALFFLYKRQSRPEKVSRFGEYRGYSAAIYDGYVRRSDYLTLADGTKLAYDVLLPMKNGVPADGPLPVLFKFTPYLRTMTMVDDDGEILIAQLFELKWYEKALLRLWAKLKKDGHLRDPVGGTPWLKNMLRHGYVIVVVERPGTGASFGVNPPSFKIAARQASEVLDWIAAQPWSDGNIGMYGDSWQAMIQYAAASTGNPRLKAIFPCSSSFDVYDAVNYPGGIYNQAFNNLFIWSNTALEILVTPVDSDEDGTLLAQALEERRSQAVGEQAEEALKKFRFRDSTLAGGLRFWEEGMGLYTLLDQINHSRVPVYNSNGWYDLFTRDMFLWHANLTVPRRLHVRPLDHDAMDDTQFDLDYGAEAHRWFDYWLKGINNGIMDELPIYYYVMGASKKDAWRTSDQWPLANQQLTRFYFAEGKTGSVTSVNDGFLRPEPPSDPNAYDTYPVDYSTASGVHSRWAAVLEAADYPNMRANDAKALTYTTPPLETDVEVTGHPVVHLWIATEAPDVDIFVYLEEVDNEGNSTYVTEGNLRASHRALSEAPFNNLGLPYQRSYESDLAPIPAGEPIELVFDLLPTSKLFHAGNRIRIAITGADADNFETPILDPAPEIRLLRNTTYASSIDLPIIPGR